MDPTLHQAREGVSSSLHFGPFVILPLEDILTMGPGDVSHPPHPPPMSTDGAPNHLSLFFLTYFGGDHLHPIHTLGFPVQRSHSRDLASDGVNFKPASPVVAQGITS